MNPEISQFEYHMAHAPAVPDWFKPTGTRRKVVVPAPDVSPSAIKWHWMDEAEPPLAHLIRWRMTYAEAVLAALRCTKPEPQREY